MAKHCSRCYTEIPKGTEAYCKPCRAVWQAEFRARQRTPIMEKYGYDFDLNDRTRYLSLHPQMESWFDYQHRGLVFLSDVPYGMSRCRAWKHIPLLEHIVFRENTIYRAVPLQPIKTELETFYWHLDPAYTVDELLQWQHKLGLRIDDPRVLVVR